MVDRLLSKFARIRLYFRASIACRLKRKECGRRTQSCWHVPNDSIGGDRTSLAYWCEIARTRSRLNAHFTPKMRDSIRKVCPQNVGQVLLVASTGCRLLPGRHLFISLSRQDSSGSGSTKSSKQWFLRVRSMNNIPTNTTVQKTCNLFKPQVMKPPNDQSNVWENDSLAQRRGGCYPTPSSTP